MTEWFSPQTVTILFAASLGGFVGSLVAIPFILLRIPPHYFDERHPRTWLKDSHPLLRIASLILKNLLGVVFLLAGIAMLVLPGQGILTMLVGLSFIDFPGKRSLERNIIGRPIIFQSINRLRTRFNRPPLIICA